MRIELNRALVACALFLLASPLAALANDKPFEHVSAEVDARYRMIFDSCIDASFETTTCQYDASSTPIRTIPVLSQAEAVLASDIVIPAFRGMKEAVWSVSLLVDPHQPLYSTERKIGLDFEALERLAVEKARRENLKPCQRACLATCISSRVIDYDNHNAVKSAYGAIETEHGVCREFATIARDLIWRLGGDARLAAGISEEVDSKTGRYRGTGGHAMTYVILDGRKYVMEPQSSSCVFYNAEFSRQKKPYSGMTVLENTGRSPSVEPSRPAVAASDWRKWLDVPGWASRGIHAFEERVSRPAN